ncbi:MAG: restriction endonuclease subunit S, partial [Gammaproteobacteria bacterium]|nr:restriction endonuclease subunit S [Gammaproteobacteria bacterium]
VTGRIDVRTGQPYPAYKESGVEWLGKVPEHWEVVALRHLATKFGSGITPRGGVAVYVPTGIPFLRSQNVHFDGLRLSGVARIPIDLHLGLNGSHVRPGDVLLNITGASIGRVCTVPDDLGDANVNQHVCIIRPRPERVLPSFLAAFLSTSGMQNAIELAQVGASRQGLTLDSIRSLKLFVPPVSEQEIIVEAVHRAWDRFTVLASAATRQIALLREYRTRLIADVVTGKLDVREVAVELPETDTLAADRDRAAAVPTEPNPHSTERDMVKEAIP